jgi:large subunit ribosomal protein L7/L12
MSSKLEQLKEKQLQLNNRIKLEENKLKVKDRKVETRKKILIGAMVLKKMENDEAYRDKVMQGLDKYLTVERDRKTFDL